MNNELIYVGLDEAGRGALSGPLVTAAVILPEGFEHELIKDSKKLSEKKRNEAFEIIKENAINYSIEIVQPHIIDTFNVLGATMWGMHECLNKLRGKFNHVLVDGNYFNEYKDVPHTCIVKGDEKVDCISAASILAKVTRDKYMVTLSEGHPKYGWLNNKGYGTKEHIAMIKEYGPTEYHRKTFIKKILS